MPNILTINKLKNAKRVVILTGAGISAESGVPTFRGEDGLWRNYNPHELATPEAFERDPRLVWEWYNWRREIIHPLEPNKGHRFIAELERNTSCFTLITQNVDGLHQKGGSKNCVELHGNIWRVRCVKEGRVFGLLDLPLKDIPPLCGCGSILRPDVVWFGESLDPEVMSKAYNAVRDCDFMMVIGTSAVVQPAGSLPLIAKENGAYVVEINIEKTPISGIVDESLIGKAGEILGKLYHEIQGH
ncbi:MAG: NAD-dependent deacylase [Nitrospinae bacterium]|nr:NAD-dependent deacylase [Nitrospinota bacterium]